MKTIYGKKPYFKNSDPIEAHDETAHKLVEMGRASFDPIKDDVVNTALNPEKITKVDPKASTIKKK